MFVSIDKQYAASCQSPLLRVGTAAKYPVRYAWVSARLPMDNGPQQPFFH